MIMSNIERITVTVPAEMAATVRAAVQSGSYVSTSEIFREALREWSTKRDDEVRALEMLRAMIAEGDEGEDIPAEEVFAELRASIDASAALRA
jgi:antitoxin ParD1/3/4